MINYRRTVVLIFILATIPVIAGGKPQPPKFVRDGFVIDGLDGTVSSEGENRYFTFFEPVTDGQGIISTSTAVQILPSGMLDKLEAAINENKNFRIWGKFTKFHNKNYIYLSYFLPITEISRPSEDVNAVGDANDEEIIPDDVLILLRPRRSINLAELKKPLSTGSDGIISDRTGFLISDGNDFYFDFEALGRNIDKLKLPLLKCEALEMMARQQAFSAAPLRFKISAIVTGYKNKNYLLLQRAERAYNHGNFTK